jgi:hypothetical protein
MKVKDILIPEADIELNIGNFLDSFYHADEQERQASIYEEPIYNRGIAWENYAYVAAMVEKLCNDYGLEAPDWIYKDEYYLQEPWFPPFIKGKARIYLMLYSPVEFLQRNLYVSENVLSRT